MRIIGRVGSKNLLKGDSTASCARTEKVSHRPVLADSIGVRTPGPLREL